MDQETKDKLTQLEQLLEETAVLSKENNRILVRMQRVGRWAFVGKIILWAIVLGVPIFFIGPMLKALDPNLGKTNGLFGLPSVEQLQQSIIDLRQQSQQGGP